MVEGASNQVEANETPAGSHRARPDWHSQVAAFRTPDNRSVAWQLANTLVPYAGLWYGMAYLIQHGTLYPLALLLVVPAAAFLVRTFILFHDCVHGSLFRSKRANRFAGCLLGTLVFTPFDDWRFSHLRHHATYANLDARGVGDVWTITRAEYNEAPRWVRWTYRMFRHPVVMMGLGSVFTFMLRSRFPTQGTGRKAVLGVLVTNLLLVGMLFAVAQGIGWANTLLIQMAVLWLAGVTGIWLFYVQHQFAGVYWARANEWDWYRAAMEGSSFYRLPAVLRWFSGNIGYHYIHHLNAGIPNYRLKRCHDAIPALQTKAPLTLWRSLSCARLKLWDEKRQELVPFS
ncbi:fatty acid desaturase [Candidatus Bipolaricaulota bacterium]|nr:fatty acid desaturase [Candidatus Bipolaricaulota bacterium]